MPSFKIGEQTSVHTQAYLLVRLLGTDDRIILTPNISKLGSAVGDMHRGLGVHSFEVGAAVYGLQELVCREGSDSGEATTGMAAGLKKWPDALINAAYFVAYTPKMLPRARDPLAELASLEARFAALSPGTLEGGIGFDEETYTDGSGRDFPHRPKKPIHLAASWPCTPWQDDEGLGNAIFSAALVVSRAARVAPDAVERLCDSEFGGRFVERLVDMVRRACTGARKPKMSRQDEAVALQQANIVARCLRLLGLAQPRIAAALRQRHVVALAIGREALASTACAQRAKLRAEIAELLDSLEQHAQPGPLELPAGQAPACEAPACEELGAVWLAQLEERLASGVFADSEFSEWASYNDAGQQRRILDALLDERARHAYARACLDDLFHEGPWTRVRVRGLSGSAELNGRTGRVVGKSVLDAKEQLRFVVELDEAGAGPDTSSPPSARRALRVRPANLAHCELP